MKRDEERVIDLLYIFSIMYHISIIFVRLRSRASGVCLRLIGF